MNNKFVIKFLKEISLIMEENKERLINMDSAVGDGDLGLTMSDGFRSAYERGIQNEDSDIGSILYFSGKAMANATPSTMGTLMASGLMSAGKLLKGKQSLNQEDILSLFLAFEEGVMNRGKAKVGEKTFIDGLHPAIEQMKQSLSLQEDMKEMVRKATIASKGGYEHTATMIAVHGRAAVRGEASRSLKDPGAYVAFLMMQALETTIETV